jgi:hypothetical protein
MFNPITFNIDAASDDELKEAALWMLLNRKGVDQNLRDLRREVAVQIIDRMSWEARNAFYASSEYRAYACPSR